MRKSPRALSQFWCLLLGLIATAAGAARGPVDARGWTWADSDELLVDTGFETPSSFTPIASPLGDDAVYPIALSFPVTLYGVTSSTVWLSSNGWISIRDPAAFAAPTNLDLPAGAPPDGMLAYFWDDLDNGPAGGSFAQAGPTPNGHLILVRHFVKATGEMVQAYIQFYRDDSVKVVYLTPLDLSSATIGIEDENGTVGNRVVFNGSVTGGAIPRDSYAIQFYRPQSPNCATAVPLPCPGMIAGDTSLGRNDVSSYGCEPGRYDGRETVYELTLSELSRVAIALTGLGARDQDLLLLGSRCEATPACVSGGADILPPTYLTPGTYYAVIDGRTAGDDGPHTVTTTCAPLATPIACGSQVAGNANGLGEIDSYTCLPGSRDGPERIYTFRLATPQVVNARLSPTAPFDLILADTATLTPIATTCRRGGDDVVAANLPAGDYALIVDGPAGAAGSFSVDLACWAVPPTFPLGPGETVATCGAEVAVGNIPYVVGVVDTRDPGCDQAAALGQNWPARMYHNEMPNPTMNPADEWRVENLGQVFGIALDDISPPNIYVTATTAFGPSANTANGQVFRLDGMTGAISRFALLPNTGPGLGNIAFDRTFGQFFATNHEDGRIYRVDRGGAILDALDPFAPDDGLPGFAPLGERLWGIGVHGGRVYFAVWTEDGRRTNSIDDNTVWSVGLDPSGRPIATDVTLEATLPPIQRDWSNPVADIAFSSEGRMIVAERSMAGDTEPSAHLARLLEYEGRHLAWTPSGAAFILGTLVGSGSNAAGGVDYTCPAPARCDTSARIWASGDAMPAYGILGLPQAGGGSNDSWIVSFGALKTQLGDVEIVRDCPCLTPPTASPFPTAATVCIGEQVTLDGSPSTGCAVGFEYRWLDGATPVCNWSMAPICDVLPSSTTVYTLEVRCLGDSNCDASATTTVTVEPRPVARTTAPTLVCAGATTTLDGTGSTGCPGALEYRWIDGVTPVCNWSTTPTCDVSPSAMTTYTLEVRCLGGMCPANATTTVDVAPRPIAAVNPDVSVCAPGPVQLDAAGSNTAGCPAGALYEWWQGATLVQPASGATTYIPPTTVVGTLSYTVVVSCAGLPGCDDPALVNVTVRDCSLAVRFAQLSATRIDRDHVAIRWTTSSELGSVLFAVERAAAPGGPFAVVGTTPATGGGSRYAFTDEGESAMLWYRVVEHTVDGRGDVSAAVATAATTNDAAGERRRSGRRR